MKFFPLLLLLLAALLPACTQTAEDRAQAVVSADIQAHFSRGSDYHAMRFDNRPYSRYDSLMYLARTGAINAAAPGTQPTVVPPPHRAADTTQVGIFVHHVYRAPGPDGENRLDSVDYVVYGLERAVELLPERVLRARLGQ